jgi:hypothetical protein
LRSSEAGDSLRSSSASSDFRLLLSGFKIGLCGWGCYIHGATSKNVRLLLSGFKIGLCGWWCYIHGATSKVTRDALKIVLPMYVPMSKKSCTRYVMYV